MAGGSETRIISTEIASGSSRVVTGFVIATVQMQDCRLNRPASSMSFLNISLALPINSFVKSSVCSNRLERDGRGMKGPGDHSEFRVHGRRPSFWFSPARFPLLPDIFFLLSFFSSLPALTENVPSLRPVAL